MNPSIKQGSQYGRETASTLRATVLKNAYVEKTATFYVSLSEDCAKILLMKRETIFNTYLNERKVSKHYNKICSKICQKQNLGIDCTDKAELA